MPILVATKSNSFRQSVNTYETTATNLGADHFWAMDEETGDYVDAIGSYDLSEIGSDATHRGVVGPFRGTPRVKAMTLNENAGGWQTANQVASVHNATTGTIGGWFVRCFASSTVDRSLVIEGRYNSTNASRWYIEIDMEGEVRFVWDGPGPTDVICIWNSAAVRNQFKANPGDTYISGSKWAHVIVVQRADGNGPQLYVNGVDYGSADSSTYTNTNANWWFNSFRSAVLANTTLNDYRIRFTTSSGGYSGMVIFNGTALTAQQVSDLYSSSNTAGGVTDYMEFVKAVDPALWKPPTNFGPSTGNNCQGSWYVRNIGNIPDPNRFRRAAWINTINDQNDWPIADLPGMDYAADALPQNVSTHIGPSNNPHLWSDLWTAANGFDTGTLNMIFEVPPVQGFNISQWLFDAVTIPAANRFRVRIVNDDLVIAVSSAAGTAQTTWEIRSSFSPGDTVMVTMTMDGNGLTTYANGVERDGADIGSVATGTATGFEWFHTLRAADRWRWYIGQRENFTQQFRANIYDFWIREGTPLTAGQIANMYGLAAGTLTQVPAPQL